MLESKFRVKKTVEYQKVVGPGVRKNEILSLISCKNDISSQDI